MRMTDNNLHESLEELLFILNSEDNKITTSDLIKYLHNTEDLAKAVNYYLNTKYAFGYDQIVMEVEAFNKGSFEIKAIFKKLSENATVAVVVGVILTKLLSNDPTPVIININGEDVSIPVSEFVESKKIRKSRSAIARTAVEARNVKSIKLEYPLDNGSTACTEIQKETLSTMIIDDEDDAEKDSYWMRNARMVIISPVLESEPASWKVRITPDNLMSAKMTDEDFLQSMSEENIAFGKGDVIVADIETVVTKREGKKPLVQNFIRKVYQYPRYPNKGPQQTMLFD